MSLQKIEEAQTVSNNTQFLKMMAEEVVDHIDLKKITDKSEVELRKMVREIVTKSSKEIVVKNLDTNILKKISVQHCQFETLLKTISANVNVYIVGPAGSGKTMAASEASKALNKSFGCMSVGPQTTQSHIMGYMDAKGNYVATEFRKRYETGGVFLFDEIDAANPGVLTCINSAIANDQCAFPDSMIKRHDDFIVIASGNTYGRGANREYVGRTQLDAATLDRFAVIEWDYDEELETTLCQNQSWAKTVQAVRRAIDNKKIRHIVSPRATFHGERLLKAGLSEEEVENMVLLKGLDKDTVEKIKNEVVKIREEAEGKKKI